MRNLHFLATAVAILLAACASNMANQPPRPNEQGMSEPTLSPGTYIPIAEAIELVKDPHLQTFLSGFAKGLSDRDDAVVAEHLDRFEFIVSHASHGNCTGGAEQYFMDKMTGKVTMGWHEHPMSEPETELEEVEPRQNGPTD